MSDVRRTVHEPAEDTVTVRRAVVMRGRRVARRIAARSYGVIAHPFRHSRRWGRRQRRLLASLILDAFSRGDLGWQDRAIAAGDAVALLRPLDRRAQWFRTLLVDGWPVYPVRVWGLDAWLIVGRNISVGYPARAIYLAAFAEVIRSDGEESKHVDAVVHALRGRPFPEQPAGRMGALVPGNGNFAHVFLGTWNALQRGWTTHAFATVDRVHDVGPATMGDWADPALFPELGAKRAPLEPSVDADGFYDGTLIPVGLGRDTVSDWRLDTDLRRGVARVAERLRSEAAADIARRMADAPVVLWCSLRGAGLRTPLNHVDWIRATLDALMRRGIEPFVAFDGLSLQPGATLDSMIRGASVNDQVAREREQVEAIMAGSPLQSVYVGGLGLHDAFYLSRFASFYVCHQGTLDHKIKWLNPDLPGLVHSNLQRTHEHAWEPTHDTVRAKSIPARFITDVKPEGFEGRPVWGAKYPYRIEPLDEAAEWTASEIAAALPGAAVRAPRQTPRAPQQVTPAG